MITIWCFFVKRMKKNVRTLGICKPSKKKMKLTFTNWNISKNFFFLGRWMMKFSLHLQSDCNFSWPAHRGHYQVTFQKTLRGNGCGDLEKRAGSQSGATWSSSIELPGQWWAGTDNAPEEQDRSRMLLNPMWVLGVPEPQHQVSLERCGQPMKERLGMRKKGKR